MPINMLLKREVKMALRGKTYPVELTVSLNPSRKSTNMGLVVLRQDDWGKRNGETYIQLYDWDDLNRGTLPRSVVEGALDKQGLLTLARAACIMAGEKNIAQTILAKYNEKTQSVRGQR
jgi:hypothetical protein